jgi:hypothetical protein
MLILPDGSRAPDPKGQPRDFRPVGWKNQKKGKAVREADLGLGDYE